MVFSSTTNSAATLNFNSALLRVNLRVAVWWVWGGGVKWWRNQGMIVKCQFGRVFERKNGRVSKSHYDLFGVSSGPGQIWSWCRQSWGVSYDGSNLDPDWEFTLVSRGSNKKALPSWSAPTKIIFGLLQKTWIDMAKCEPPQAPVQWAALLSEPR